MPTPTQSVEPENVETDEPSAEPTAEIDPAAEGETDTDSGVVTAPSPSAPPFNEADLVTVANNASFAAIMALDDPCSADIAAFARDYRGDFLRFDAYVIAMANSATNASRLDIVVGGSPHGTVSPLGPEFQFRSVAPDPDLGLSGTIFPGMINVGESFTFTASVLSFDSVNCVVVLDPYTSVLRT
jgi:hypothetical protein